MKSVWVIEQGSYSDYRVVGVFSSRENAEVVLKFLGESSSGPEISEWPMNPAVEDINAGRSMFCVWMDKGGLVEHVRAVEPPLYNVDESFDIWRRSQGQAYEGQNKSDLLMMTVWAKDADHAIKIVAEKNAQMIAEGKW